MSDKAANQIIYLVAVIWAANIVLAMIPATGYKPDPLIHGIFMSIVGGAFVAKSRDNGTKDDKEKARK